MAKQTKQKRLEERGKIAVNFEVDPETHEKIQKLAEQEDRSKSAVIRRIIAHYFADAGI